MKNKFRFHLLSLVHLPQSRTYLSCAFTQKNRKLAKMLTSLGHEVFFYGSEGSDVAEYCNSDNLHFVQTHTLKDIRDDYGDGDNRFEIGYDWTNTDFRHDFNAEPKHSTRKFNFVASEMINHIKKDSDFLLCSQGIYHKPIAEAVKLFLTCESGIGYRGSVKEWFRSFESAYIQNFSYGSEHPYESMNGSYYDRVIPNYFDPDDVLYSPKKENYFLFIGRMIKRKGILSACMACDVAKKKLIIVGQGGLVDKDGNLTATDRPDFVYPKGTWEYQGFADVEKRKQLMAHATAVFTPTEYLECFAGTHVEAMLAGTPIITTDFAVFGGNTFQNNVHGFKCNTLDDFVWAVNHAKNLKPAVIRKHAERFLMDNVRWDFQKWFEDLYFVYESAKDSKKKGWSRIRDFVPEWRKQIYR